MDSINERRQFLEKLGVTTAGIVTAGYTATAAGFAANDTLTVGCIGTGGRCRQLMQWLQKLPGVKIAAVCDIWDNHLQAGQKLAEPNAFATKDHHALLARKDIDAVLIGSPDHLHVPLTIDALAAGKHVYVEKPLTHELSEGQKIIDAQKKAGLVVQVGTQQRSMPQFIKARELIKSGAIGHIYKVHLTWNRNQDRARRNPLGVDPKTVDWKRFLGPAKDQPFDEYRFRNWRWFWDFGGGIFTDLMVHFIDVAHWFLDLDHPEVAASIGDHFTTAGVWETPDTVQTLLRFPKQDVQVYFEGTFANARNAAMLEFMGSEATLYLDRGRYEVHPERKKKIAASEWILGEGPRSGDFYNEPQGETLHLANWIQAIREKKEPNAPVSAGVQAASSAHLANLSLRRGQFMKWDSVKG